VGEGVTCDACGERFDSEVPLAVTDKEWTKRHWHPDPLESFQAGEAARGRRLHGKQFRETGESLLGRKPLSLPDWKRQCLQIRKSVTSRRRSDWTARELKKEFPLLRTAADELDRKDFNALLRYVQWSGPDK